MGHVIGFFVVLGILLGMNLICAGAVMVVFTTAQWLAPAAMDIDIVLLALALLSLAIGISGCFWLMTVSERIVNRLRQRNRACARARTHQDATTNPARIP